MRKFRPYTDIDWPRVVSYLLETSLKYTIATMISIPSAAPLPYFPDMYHLKTYTIRDFPFLTFQTTTNEPQLAIPNYQS